MQMIGEPLVRNDRNGKEAQRFGEHVMRVAGAQSFARRGIELFMIQSYARWGSSAILRYVQDAPLSSQARVAGKLAATMRHMNSLENINEEISVKVGKAGSTEVRKACKEFLEKGASVVRPGELEALVRRVDVLESKVDKKHEFVMNTETFCVHKVRIWGDDIQASTW